MTAPKMEYASHEDWVKAESGRMTIPATTPADGELLPCPFGCKSGLTVYQSLDCEYVICDRCESTGPAAKTREKAIAAWNRRATPSPGKADAEDAARYRRIRNGPHSDRHGDVYAMVFMPDGDEPIHGAKLDSVVDAAIKRDKQ